MLHAPSYMTYAPHALAAVLTDTSEPEAITRERANVSHRLRLFDAEHQHEMAATAPGAARSEREASYPARRREIERQAARLVDPRLIRLDELLENRRGDLSRKLTAAPANPAIRAELSVATRLLSVVGRLRDRGEFVERDEIEAVLAELFAACCD